MKYITPITDRTRIDVLGKTSKGYINLDDWLRIYGNVRLVSAIGSILEGVPFTEITEPTRSYILNDEEINTLVNNIIEIVGVFGTPAQLALLRNNWGGVDSPKYSDVNAWESVTEELFYVVTAAFTGWDTSTGTGRFPRTDSAICGTGITRQNGFRRYA